MIKGRIWWIKCAVFFICIPIYLRAQQSAVLPKQEQIHSLVRYYEEEKDFNGNILVVENGKIIYENALGWANVEENVALTLNTPFYLASISKTFTAMSIMILEEEGKLSYNDPISLFFKDLGPVAERLQIWHLLSHTSGLPDYFAMGWDAPGFNNAQLYSRLRNDPRQLNFKPGQKFSYNNTGYVLLAMIVEEVAGVPYYKFVNERICEPLGMENTWVYDLRNTSRIRDGMAVGYRNNMKRRSDYDLLTWGDGGMYSTIEDLYTWDRALYSNVLIGSESLEAAYTPVTLVNGTTKNYGYGWVLGSNLNGKTVSHTGGLAGFRNYFERQIEVENSIIILSNNSNDDITEMRNILVKILDGRPYEFPEN